MYYTFLLCHLFTFSSYVTFDGVLARGDRQQTAIRDEIYDYVVQLVENRFDVPCSKRNAEHLSALRYFYRSKDKLTIIYDGTKPILILGKSITVQQCSASYLTTNKYVGFYFAVT